MALLISSTVKAEGQRTLNPTRTTAFNLDRMDQLRASGTDTIFEYRVSDPNVLKWFTIDDAIADVQTAKQGYNKSKSYEFTVYDLRGNTATRTLDIDNIIYMNADAENPSTRTKIHYAGENQTVPVNYTVDGDLATLVTAINAINDVVIQNVGTSASNVTAVEYGDGKNHITELTISGMTIAIAGAAAEANGAALYTLPAGVQFYEVTNMNIALQGGGTVDTDTPDVGIGSVVATGAVSVLGGTATFEDYITGQTATDCSGTDIPAFLAPTAGFGAGIALNKTGDTKTMFVNVADTWAGADTITVSGTVTLKWSNM